MEADTRPQPDYIAARHGPAAHPGGAHIEAGMRRTTVGWMVEVGAECRLHQETLHLAIALLDRFLGACSRLHRGSLQLAALAACLVAAKHEEEAFPPAAGLAALAGGGVAAADLVRMEGVLLQAIGFRVAGPTAATWASLVGRAARAGERAGATAAYLLELAALDYACLSHAPSALAAAAVVLAAREGAAARAARAAALACPDHAALDAASRSLFALHAAAAARVAAALAVGEGGDGGDPADPADPSSNTGPDAVDAVIAKFAAPEWHAVSTAPTLA